MPTMTKKPREAAFVRDDCEWCGKELPKRRQFWMRYCCVNHKQLAYLKREADKKQKGAK